MTVYFISNISTQLFKNSYDVMLKCWRDLPDKRPSFAELVPMLSSLLEEIAGYMDFSIFKCSKHSEGYDHLESLKGYDHLEPARSSDSNRLH